MLVIEGEVIKVEAFQSKKDETFYQHDVYDGQLYRVYAGKELGKKGSRVMVEVSAQIRRNEIAYWANREQSKK